MLGETWRSWIPLVYCGLTLVAGLQQWATVTTSGSYLSASDPRVHFGLGNDLNAASIEVKWPSGVVQVLANVKGDRQIQIDEPPSPSAAPR